MAPVAPFGRDEPSERAFWAGLSEAVAGWSRTISEWLISGPNDRVSLLMASWLPEALLSGCFIGLLYWLYKSRDQLEIETVFRIRSFGFSFVVLALFAAPAQVSDFWLSIAWGRMVLEGINPYTAHLEHSPAMTSILQGLPVDPDLPGMTYGPLWALVSALLCGIARLLSNSVWAEAILFKALLATAWVSVIFVVDRTLRDRSHWERAFGVAVAGWLPLGPIQAVAEGHNDAVVVALLALWIAGVSKTRSSLPSSTPPSSYSQSLWSTLALTASALCKYVTAPLLLLDLASAGKTPTRDDDRRRPHPGGRLRWFVKIGAVVILIGFAFAPFLRSLDMFHSALRMRDWKFLTPREAVIPIQLLLGTWPGGDWSLLLQLARALPLGMGLFAVILWLRDRDDAVRFHEAAVGILLAIVLSGLGHAWPWFLLWPVPIAVMAPRGWIMRLWVALALALPFGFGFIIHGSGLPHRLRFDLPTFGCYLLAAAIFVILPARWFPSAPRGTFPHGTG